MVDEEEGATGGGGDEAAAVPTSSSVSDDKMDVSEPRKTKSSTQSSSSSSPTAGANVAAAAAAAAAEAIQKCKLDELGILNESDLLLMCHLHYLPFDHGPRGVAFLKEASWLIDNVSRLEGLETKPPQKLKSDLPNTVSTQHV